MQDIAFLPGQIKDIHHLLEPFVRKAQDVTHIRRVLAIHLSSHIITTGDAPISRPLSLLEPGREVGPTAGIRGIRREYTRCVGAHIKAREEYSKISKEHQVHANPARQEESLGGRDGHVNSLESFLELVKYRRKHDRLRILQDYNDTLAQKPAAASDYLDPGAVLKDVDSLPSVPADVMSGTRPLQETQRTDLNSLADQLEKSVLKAKILLAREQKLLSKVKAEGASRTTSPGGRLQALGTARNELITWIETELAMAGESAADPDSQYFKTSEKKGKDHIDGQLSSIQRQYVQYIKARQALNIAAAWSPEALASTVTTDNTTVLAPKEESEKTDTMSHVLHPYLEEFASVSNQQKSAIQQRSHLTITLSKQLKEGSQGLNRLAEESHLLPSYPLAGLQRKALDTTFGDEISSLEKPNSSRGARAWVHASELASKAMKEAVADNLEEGEVAIQDAHHTLLDIQYLLGGHVDTENRSRKVVGDIWATLDGRLDVIKRAGLEEL